MSYYDPRLLGTTFVWPWSVWPQWLLKETKLCQQTTGIRWAIVSASITIPKSLWLHQTVLWILAKPMQKALAREARKEGIMQLDVYPFQLIRYTDEGRWIIECQWCETRDLFFGMAATTFRLEWRCIFCSAQALFPVQTMRIHILQIPPQWPPSTSTWQVNTFFTTLARLENSHSK